MDLINGTQWVIQISGGPGWGDGFKGWTASLSKNAGQNFTEYEKFFEGEYEVIVGMASLLQIKEGGKYVDKWVGIFHDYSAINYRTYLTFDSEGNQQWTKPETLLAQWRDIEYSLFMCEILMFRDPNSD